MQTELSLAASRRRFLLGGLSAAGVAFFTVPGAYAEQLELTPLQTEGPFYPNKLPLDTDNDLLIVNDGITPAVGEVTHLSGRLLDAKGDPIRNALVEIWQVDNAGIYIHTNSPNRANFDANFQGFGRFMTGSTGEYYFRTIKPVAYGTGQMARAPHIHFAVKAKGRERITTQCYVKGDPKNAADFVMRETESKMRDRLIVDFKPMGNATGELAAKFDIVLA